jgi:hypothetical protein
MHSMLKVKASSDRHMCAVKSDYIQNINHPSIVFPFQAGLRLKTDRPLIFRQNAFKSAYSILLRSISRGNTSRYMRTSRFRDTFSLSLLV